jgi:hypothetical protein
VWLRAPSRQETGKVGLAQAQGHGLEGLVSKHRDRPMEVRNLRIGFARIGRFMKPDEDEAKNPNLATTLASIAIDTAKLITGVPLAYPGPMLTSLATVPQPSREEYVMDDEKEKPLVDQMTDVVADAAGELAKTAVKAVAERAKKAVVRNTPTPVKKAAKTVAKAAKAPKKTVKKAVKKAKKSGTKPTKKAAPKKTAKTSAKKKSKKSKR